MLLGPPADWTHLRIVKRAGPGRDEESYTTTESDAAGQPVNWIRGGTWTHSLGANAKSVSWRWMAPDLPPSSITSASPPPSRRLRETGNKLHGSHFLPA